ncbi:transposase [Salipiger bermudensis]|nr:transposase [Salipiger bermudensis]
MPIFTDKAQSYAKLIDEWNARSGPEGAIRLFTRKHLNNRIEGDHAVL